MKRSLILFMSVAIGLTTAYIVEPGPVVKATKGGVWPKPREQSQDGTYFVFRPTLFKFQATGADCDILEDAFQRYWGILQRTKRPHKNVHKFWRKDRNFRDNLDILNVNVASCKDGEYPTLNMDESYFLDVPAGTLTANSGWGALRGLETFSQLIHFAEDETTLIINATVINDYPRFSHRGLLIDTSRHFIPVYVLRQMLDAMSYNKINVFHWHIVDDHSFPFQSLLFPELSEKGAYHPSAKVYSIKDVDDIIEYARLRGIRVIPEFDTPGHTRSWGLGIPELLTACQGNYEGKYGPLDVSNPFVYSFLSDLFSEINERFPDEYVHLGGDEVGFECWESSEAISQFMESLGIAGDYVALESYYIHRLIDISKNFTFHPIVWEEVFTNGVDISNQTTIVHVWIEGPHAEVLRKVTEAGFYGIQSGCWYLDHLANGGDWHKYYECEPLSFNGTAQQEALVMGGEACMWAEVVNEYNIGSRIWPRASATAEKLWSARDADTIDEAAKRLEEHTCRMNARGINAQPPNGPGFCL